MKPPKHDSQISNLETKCLIHLIHSRPHYLDGYIFNSHKTESKKFYPSGCLFMSHPQTLCSGIKLNSFTTYYLFRYCLLLYLCPAKSLVFRDISTLELSPYTVLLIWKVFLNTYTHGDWPNEVNIYSYLLETDGGMPASLKN